MGADIRIMSENSTESADTGTSMAAQDTSQNMLSANTFADIFKTALAPVIRQLSSLNNNVTTVLQSGHEESDEDGETASIDEPANSGDMDADVSALLAAAGTDQNNEAMPGDELLKELAQDLTVSEKTSPPLREGLAAIFNNLIRKDGGGETKGKVRKIPPSRERTGFAHTQSKPFDLEPALHCHESTGCPIAERTKHPYRRNNSHDKGRRFGSGKKQPR